MIGITKFVTCFSLNASASARINSSNSLSENRDGDKEGRRCAVSVLLSSYQQLSALLL
jgi:hypothetical protein